MRIRTLDYGIVPVAKNTVFVHDDIIGLVEADNGDSYLIKRAFSGSLVAIKI